MKKLANRWMSPFMKNSEPRTTIKKSFNLFRLLRIIIKIVTANPIELIKIKSLLDRLALKILDSQSGRPTPKKYSSSR